MFPWYSEENKKYIEDYMQSDDCIIYWSNEGCYYWTPMIKLPSGNWVEFTCYNKTYAPKHDPWEIRGYTILPTQEQRTWLENKQSEDNKRKLQEHREAKRKHDFERNTSLLLADCIKGLMQLDSMHKQYF